MSRRHQIIQIKFDVRTATDVCCPLWGGEGKGKQRILKQACDLRIPQLSHSLPASDATAKMLACTCRCAALRFRRDAGRDKFSQVRNTIIIILM
jgi:hypothetical protein